MMNCSRILTRRVTTTLPLQAYKSVSGQSFSALVSIEDEFPGYVTPKSTGTLVPRIIVAILFVPCTLLIKVYFVFIYIPYFIGKKTSDINSSTIESNDHLRFYTSEWTESDHRRRRHQLHCNADLPKGRLFERNDPRTRRRLRK